MSHTEKLNQLADLQAYSQEEERVEAANKSFLYQDRRFKLAKDIYMKFIEVDLLDVNQQGQMDYTVAADNAVFAADAFMEAIEIKVL